MTDASTPNAKPAPVPGHPNEDRHVIEPEIHQDLLDPDGATDAEAGTPGRDENAPGFVKPAAG